MQSSNKIFLINENNFKDLFKEYYSGLCKYCMKFVRKHEIAEEIVQDQFIYLWKKRNKIKITSSIEQYLFKSVKNKSIDYLRSSYVKLNFENEDVILNKEASNPANEIEMKELAFIIEKAIKKLPQKCYTIFTLSRHGGLSNIEIANKLEISTKTVENQITIALRKIKEYIENNR
jgi:RNA polymerase sigma-70 factor (ECF subfamily)